jgi:hypothetical protein
MLLALLVDKLRIDAEDPLLEWDPTRRGMERAVAQLNHDLNTAYVLTGNDSATTVITPDPPPLHQEALLLIALRYLAGLGRLRLTDLVSWQSGDKQVDRSKQAGNKTDLVDSLWQEYVALLGLTEA